MEIMKNFTQKIKDLKLKNDDLINFTVRFEKDEIYLTGELHEDGEVDNFYCGKLASFFIPTAKGYVSAEWKKTKFWKMKRELVTEGLLIELMPYLQSETPKTFMLNTGDGWGVAGVMANHINNNSGDPYDKQ